MKLKEFAESNIKLAIKFPIKMYDEIFFKIINNPKCFLIERLLESNSFLLVNKKTYFHSKECDLKIAPIEILMGEISFISQFDVEEFEPFYNFEKDVADYFAKCVIDNHFLNHNKIIIIPARKETRDMLIINKEKKYVLLKIKGKEYRVDCHKDDEFNWQIGFGLALSKCFGKECKWQRARENFRHTITDDKGNVKRVLDYESYSKWCIYEYYHNDTDDMANLVKRVKEIYEYGKVDL